MKKALYILSIASFGTMAAINIFNQTNTTKTMTVHDRGEKVFQATIPGKTKNSFVLKEPATKIDIAMIWHETDNNVPVLAVSPLKKTIVAGVEPLKLSPLPLESKKYSLSKTVRPALYEKSDFITNTWNFIAWQSGNGTPKILLMGPALAQVAKQAANLRR